MLARMMLIGAITAGLTLGCDEAQNPAAVTATNAQPTDTLPPNLALVAAPAGPKDVSTIKASVKTGDRVAVRGVIAGREDPIAENRAILTLLDAAVQTCDKNPADGCKTPWDACCEPSDVLAKNSLTVQVVDADGRPIKTSLASVSGVKPLAKLIVTGTADVSDDGVVLVNADGVHVEQ